MISWGRFATWLLGVVALSTIAIFFIKLLRALYFVELQIVDVVLGIFLGILAADLFSGLVHWACDTWGDSRIPLLGTYVLKSFRLHHVDQLGITRHDFFEANILNFLAVVPVIIATANISLDSRGSIFAVVFLGSLCFFSMLTNQVHKWSHQAHQNKIISWLQKYGVILSPKAHKKHHSKPYTESYCITTGWLNPLLDKIRFFRGLEWLISSLTGAIPRHEEVHFHQ